MSLKLTKKIIMGGFSWQNSFDIFFFVLQEHFVYE